MITKYRILFFILFTSCNLAKKDSRILIFEDFLGANKIAVLDKAVYILDSVLTNTYQSNDINENYQYFLNDINENKLDWDYFFRNNEIKNLHNQAKLSGLWNELFLKLKSIEYKNGEIVSNYIYIPEDTLTEYISVESRILLPIQQYNNIQIDSLIQQEKKIKEHNTEGKYIKALELIQDNDSLIIEYLVLKEIAGSISPNLLPRLFKESNADFNDYFARRIIAIELLF